MSARVLGRDKHAPQLRPDREDPGGSGPAELAPLACCRFEAIADAVRWFRDRELAPPIP